MSVIQLADRRKPKIVRNDINLPRWWCIRCDSDVFKILSTGAVHCSICYGLVREIQARET